MHQLTLILAEAPFIAIMGLVAYLAFEHWRFPDLSIESSFFSGTVFAYLITSASDFAIAPPITYWLCFLTPLILVLINWGLNLFGFPTLLGGLLVLWIGGSINYWTNGQTVSQQVDTVSFVMRIPFLTTNISHFTRAKSPSEQIFFLYVALVILIMLLVFVLSKTRWHYLLLLSRHIRSETLLSATNIKSAGLLLTGMLFYSYIAFAGGIATGLHDSTSSVSFIAAIAPGLCIMFFFRAIRDISSLPERKDRNSASRVLSWIRRKADSMGYVTIGIVILSVLLSALRHLVRTSVANLPPGILNAMTAIVTVALWLVIIGVANLAGKHVRSISPME